MAKNNTTPKPACDTMRAMLSTKEDTHKLLDIYIDRMAKEQEGDTDADPLVDPFWTDILRRQAHFNTEGIYALCESPIEKYFWNSFQFEFLSRNDILVIDQYARSTPMEERRGIYRGMCECKAFYEALPDGARPAKFEQFLEVKGCPDVTATASGAMMYHDLTWIHCFHLDLQSSMRGSEGKTIRPDGVLWIPSDERVKVVIECDGFDYHSDKEAFTRDRQRDRWFSMNGFDVRRYSGSEIFKDPATCTHDLADYIYKHFEPSSAHRKQWSGAVKKRKPSEHTIAIWRKRMAGENV